MYTLELNDEKLVALPEGFVAPEYRLALDGCWRLRGLPEQLSVPVLSLAGCASLVALPRTLDVVDLDLSGCRRLAKWPQQISARIGRMNVSGCERITWLPGAIETVAVLDVSGCRALRDFPPTLTVTRRIEVAGTELSALPRLGPHARVTWRGVEVPPFVATNPERIDVPSIHAADRALRRVLLERLGYRRYVASSPTTTLDRDRDAGGDRALLCAEVPDDEALVVLHVRCPSTGNEYMLRVPPTTKTCHDAAAWIAGFDDASAYAPRAET